MERDEAKDIWGEICFLLSSNIKSDISEKNFEYQVVRAIEKLGWLEYKNEIGRQVSIQFGRKALRPDLVIYDSDNKPSVPVEIKRPSEDLSNDLIDGQLKSYMLQLKAKFGLVIGDGVKLFYDGPEKDNIIDDPILLIEIAFEPSSHAGIDFVLNFNKTCLLNQCYKLYIKKLIEKIRAKRNINQLKEDLRSSSTVEKIFNFLRKEYREFGADIVDQALASITIQLNIDDQIITAISPPVTTATPEKGMSILDTVYNLIAKNQNGVTKSDLAKITGLKNRQLSNALCKLVRQEKINPLERGMYISSNSKPASTSKAVSIKKVSKNPESLTGNLLSVYKAICRKKNGNGVDEIEYRSGLVGRQVSNALYKLSTMGMIKKVKKGHYAATEYIQPAEKKPKQKNSFSQNTASSNSILETIYKFINSFKGGVDVQTIREKTELDTRQVSNALYKLTKRGRIETIDHGKYVAL